VQVIDNGVGMSRERIDIDFAQLGGSWKKLANSTEGGRHLHGRSGQGRFAAYALGGTVRWASISDDVTGTRLETVVTGRQTSLRDFDVSDPLPTDLPTGTTVECTNLTEEAQAYLLRDDVAENLATIFALVLEQYPVTISWRGQNVDPSLLQTKRHTAPLEVDGVEGAELVVIEWKRQTRRALHLCESSGASLHEIAPGIHAPGFEFTAYVRWDGFKDLQSQLSLEEMGETVVASVIEAARDALRDYFKARAAERGSELVQAWKDDNTYPYRDEPETTVDKAERDLFNVLAVAAAPAVETTDTGARRLSLRLLREAIERTPGTVHELLQEVLNLPEDRLDELRELVERTSLTSIIAAARRVTDRLDFLAGLEKIVFDSSLRRHILERRQLQRILVNETWVFREEYALTADDVTLRTALRDHIGLLGRADLAPDDLSSEVLDEDGRRVVVDMMLSRVVEQTRNEREHIVIELKRPTVHIGGAQITQIANYAATVAGDARFASTNTHWEFWIVGDVLDQVAQSMANQQNREPGIVTISPDGSQVIRAVTWAKIIQDARHRLSFVKNALEYSTDEERGMSYLRRAHGRFLPETPMASDADSANGDPESSPATVTSPQDG
jgi:hypothetical protein